MFQVLELCVREISDISGLCVLVFQVLELCANEISDKSCVPMRSVTYPGGVCLCFRC